MPVGLLVALIIHTTIFPFHARAQLSLAISSSLDWLHHLLYAIELSSEQPWLTTQFPSLIRRTRRRVRFANSLVPATRYEISLAGQFPTDGFLHILDRIEGILLLILGESATKCTIPILASAAIDPALAGLVTGVDRGALLASLCNDLLVTSHTLIARLHLPRHASHSSTTLSDYVYNLRYSPFGEEIGLLSGDFSDVGRLFTIVNEMAILKQEVDWIMGEAAPEGNRMRSRSASNSTRDLFSVGPGTGGQNSRVGTPNVTSRSNSRGRMYNGYASRTTTPVGPSRTSTPASTQEIKPREITIEIKEPIPRRGTAGGRARVNFEDSV